MFKILCPSWDYGMKGYLQRVNQKERGRKQRQGDTAEVLCPSVLMPRTSSAISRRETTPESATLNALEKPHILSRFFSYMSYRHLLTPCSIRNWRPGLHPYKGSVSTPAKSFLVGVDFHYLRQYATKSDTTTLWPELARMGDMTGSRIQMILYAHVLQLPLFYINSARAPRFGAMSPISVGIP